jgi:hypothetical protein
MLAPLAVARAQPHQQPRRCLLFVSWREREQEQLAPRAHADEPSGRHSARETLEDELWLSRARLMASASRCSSWRSAASARGSRLAAAILRPPCERHSEPDVMGRNLKSTSSSPNANTAARAATAGGMTRLSSQSSTRLAIAEATHEAILRTSLLTRRRSFTRLVRSLLLKLLYPRLQRGEEGQGCSWRDRAAGSKQGARDLLELCQRRVALERLRERRGARVADLIGLQTAARNGG